MKPTSRINLTAMLFGAAVACSDAPSKQETVLVIGDNNATNNANNTNNNNVTNNVMNNDACCEGRVCGSAPTCVDVVCGMCDANAFCTAQGSCEAVAEDAPQILELSSNTMQVTPSTLLVVTAIVTDPDGIDDVIGGSLKAPSGATYGAFQTAASEGAYQISLDWQQLHALQSIVFEAPIQRDLIAEFFDQSGNRVQRTLTITIACESSDSGVCENGQCVNLLTSPLHCGACGNDLTPGEADCVAGQATCEDGVYCPQSQLCATDYRTQACGTCANNCDERFEALNKDVSSAEFLQVSCSNGGCIFLYEGRNRTSCDIICGEATCFSSNAVFDGTTVSRDCTEDWGDPSWNASGTFEQVACKCSF